MERRPSPRRVSAGQVRLGLERGSNGKFEMVAASVVDDAGRLEVEGVEAETASSTESDIALDLGSRRLPPPPPPWQP